MGMSLGEYLNTEGELWLRDDLGRMKFSVYNLGTNATE